MGFGALLDIRKDSKIAVRMSTRIAPIPLDEEARQSALQRLEILDTAPERAYDDIVELASAICGTPIAAMTLLDGQRQWFKAKVGLPFDETPREEAFCAHAIMQPDLFVVQDAEHDERFADMLAVKFSGVRFYAGSPIKSPDGFPLGTLCVLDVQSRDLTPVQSSALEALRRMVESHLELRRANHELVRLERQKRELTELVVHDLKNPIASILPNAKYLARAKNISPDERSAAVDIASASQAMLRLTLNILDISRAEEAMLVANREPVEIAALVEGVRATLAGHASEDGTTLVVEIAGDVDGVAVDRDLVRRLLENLGDNALKYASRGVVTLNAQREGSDLVLSVSDDGPGIPEADRERIFDKYARVQGAGHTERSRGLGLAFCKLACEAHGGTIKAEANTPRGMIFRARLPLG